MTRSQFSLSALLWLCLLLAVPITTPPFIPLRHTLVKPLAMIPALLLLGLILVAGRRGTLRVKGIEAILLIAFVGWALILGFANAVMLPGVEYNDLTPLAAFFRAAASLVIGIAIYLSFRVFVRSRDQADMAERVLLSALGVSCIIAILQMVGRAGVAPVGGLTRAVTGYLVDSPVWVSRSHGLAFEPSWLASQIGLLIIPLAGSRILAREPLGWIRLGEKAIRLEVLFFVIGLAALVATASRTGLLAVGLALPVGAVALVRDRLDRRRLQIMGAGFVIIAIAFFALLQAGYISKTVDAATQADSFLDFAGEAQIAPRMASWMAGLNTFLAHPIDGVGLGNSPRYFSEHVPAWGVEYWEVQQWLAQTPGYRSNPKNFPVKLLAETGIIGAALSLTFILIHFRRQSVVTPRWRVLRAMTFVAMAVTFFQGDSFASPELWLALGFVHAAGRWGTQRQHAALQPSPAKKEGVSSSRVLH